MDAILETVDMEVTADGAVQKETAVMGVSEGGVPSSSDSGLKINIHDVFKEMTCAALTAEISPTEDEINTFPGEKCTTARVIENNDMESKPHIQTAEIEAKSAFFTKRAYFDDEMVDVESVSTHDKHTNSNVENPHEEEEYLSRLNETSLRESNQACNWKMEPGIFDDVESESAFVDVETVSDDNISVEDVTEEIQSPDLLHPFMTEDHPFMTEDHNSESDFLPQSTLHSVIPDKVLTETPRTQSTFSDKIQLKDKFRFTDYKEPHGNHLTLALETESPSSKNSSNRFSVESKKTTEKSKPLNWTNGVYTLTLPVQGNGSTAAAQGECQDRSAFTTIQPSQHQSVASLSADTDNNNRVDVSVKDFNSRTEHTCVTPSDLLKPSAQSSYCEMSSEELGVVISDSAFANTESPLQRTASVQKTEAEYSRKERKPPKVTSALGETPSLNNPASAYDTLSTDIGITYCVDNSSSLKEYADANNSDGVGGRLSDVPSTLSPVQNSSASETENTDHNKLTDIQTTTLNIILPSQSVDPVVRGAALELEAKHVAEEHRHDVETPAGTNTLEQETENVAIGGEGTDTPEEHISAELTVTETATIDPEVRTLESGAEKKGFAETETDKTETAAQRSKEDVEKHEVMLEERSAGEQEVQASQMATEWGNSAGEQEVQASQMATEWGNSAEEEAQSQENVVEAFSDDQEVEERTTVVENRNIDGQQMETTNDATETGIAEPQLETVEVLGNVPEQKTHIVKTTINALNSEENVDKPGRVAREEICKQESQTEETAEKNDCDKRDKENSNTVITGTDHITDQHAEHFPNTHDGYQQAEHFPNTHDGYQQAEHFPNTHDGYHQAEQLQTISEGNEADTATRETMSEQRNTAEQNVQTKDMTTATNAKQQAERLQILTDSNMNDQQTETSTAEPDLETSRCAVDRSVTKQNVDEVKTTQAPGHHKHTVGSPEGVAATGISEQTVQRETAKAKCFGQPKRENTDIVDERTATADQYVDIAAYITGSGQGQNLENVVTEKELDTESKMVATQPASELDNVIEQDTDDVETAEQDSTTGQETDAEDSTEDTGVKQCSTESHLAEKGVWGSFQTYGSENQLVSKQQTETATEIPDIALEYRLLTEHKTEKIKIVAETGSERGEKQEAVNRWKSIGEQRMETVNIASVTRLAADRQTLQSDTAEKEEHVAEHKMKTSHMVTNWNDIPGREVDAVETTAESDGDERHVEDPETDTDQRETAKEETDQRETPSEDTDQRGTPAEETDQRETSEEERDQRGTPAEDTDQRDTSEEETDQIENSTEEERDQIENSTEEQRDQIENSTEEERDQMENSTEEERDQTENSTEEERDQMENSTEEERDQTENSTEEERDQMENSTEEERDQMENSTEEERDQMENSTEEERDQMENSTEEERDHMENSTEEERDQTVNSIEEERDQMENSTEEERDQMENSTEEERDHMENSTEKESDQMENSTEKERDQMENSTEEERDQIENSTEKERDQIENSKEEERDQMENSTEKERDQIENSTEKERDQMENSTEKERDQTVNSIEEERDQMENSTEEERDQTENSTEEERDQTVNSIEEERDQMENSTEEERDQIENSKEEERDQMENSTEEERDQTVNSIEEERDQMENSTEEERDQTENSTEEERDQTVNSIEEERDQMENSTEEERDQTENSTEEERDQTVNSIEEERDQMENSTEEERDQTENSTEEERDQTVNSIEEERDQMENSTEEERDQTVNSIEEERDQMENSTEEERDQTVNSIEEERDQMENSTEEERYQTVNSIEEERDQMENSTEEERDQTVNSIEEERDQMENSTEEERDQTENSIEEERDQMENSTEEERDQTVNSIEEERDQMENSTEEERDQTVNSTEEERDQMENSTEEERDQTENSIEEERDQTVNSIEEERDQTVNSIEEERDQMENSTEEERDQTENSIEEERDQTENSTEEERDQTVNSIEEERDQTENSTEEERDQMENSTEEERDQTVNSIEEERDQMENSTEEERDQTENSIEEERDQTENSTEEERDQTVNSIEEERDQTENSTEEERDQTVNSIEEERDQTENSTEEERDQTENSTEEERDQTENSTEEERDQTENSTEETEETDNWQEERDPIETSAAEETDETENSSMEETDHTDLSTEAGKDETETLTEPSRDKEDCPKHDTVHPKRVAVQHIGKADIAAETKKPEDGSETSLTVAESTNITEGETEMAVVKAVWSCAEQKADSVGSIAETSSGPQRGEKTLFAAESGRDAQQQIETASETQSDERQAETEETESEKSRAKQQTEATETNGTNVENEQRDNATEWTRASEPETDSAETWDKQEETGKPESAARTQSTGEHTTEMQIHSGDAAAQEPDVAETDSNTSLTEPEAEHIQATEEIRISEEEISTVQTQTETYNGELEVDKQEIAVTTNTDLQQMEMTDETFDGKQEGEKLEPVGKFKDITKQHVVIAQATPEAGIAKLRTDMSEASLDINSDFEQEIDSVQSRMKTYACRRNVEENETVIKRSTAQQVMGTAEVAGGVQQTMEKAERVSKEETIQVVTDWAHGAEEVANTKDAAGKTSRNELGVEIVTRNASIAQHETDPGKMAAEKNSAADQEILSREMATWWINVDKQETEEQTAEKSQATTEMGCVAEQQMEMADSAPEASGPEQDAGEPDISAKTTCVPIQRIDTADNSADTGSSVPAAEALKSVAEGGDIPEQETDTPESAAEASSQELRLEVPESATERTVAAEQDTEEVRRKIIFEQETETTETEMDWRRLSDQETKTTDLVTAENGYVTKTEMMSEERDVEQDTTSNEHAANTEQMLDVEHDVISRNRIIGIENKINVTEIVHEQQNDNAEDTESYKTEKMNEMGLESKGNGCTTSESTDDDCLEMRGNTFTSCDSVFTNNDFIRQNEKGRLGGQSTFEQRDDSRKTAADMYAETVEDTCNTDNENIKAKDTRNDIPDTVVTAVGSDHGHSSTMSQSQADGVDGDASYCDGRHGQLHDKETDVEKGQRDDHCCMLTMVKEMEEVIGKFHMNNSDRESMNAHGMKNSDEGVTLDKEKYIVDESENDKNIECYMENKNRDITGVKDIDEKKDHGEVESSKNNAHNDKCHIKNKTLCTGNTCDRSSKEKEKVSKSDANNEENSKRFERITDNVSTTVDEKYEGDDDCDVQTSKKDSASAQHKFEQKSDNSDNNTDAETMSNAQMDEKTNLSNNELNKPTWANWDESPKITSPPEDNTTSTAVSLDRESDSDYDDDNTDFYAKDISFTDNEGSSSEERSLLISSKSTPAERRTLNVSITDTSKVSCDVRTDDKTNTCTTADQKLTTARVMRDDQIDVCNTEDQKEQYDTVFETETNKSVDAGQNGETSESYSDTLDSKEFEKSNESEESSDLNNTLDSFDSLPDSSCYAKSPRDQLPNKTSTMLSNWESNSSKESETGERRHRASSSEDTEEYNVTATDDDTEDCNTDDMSSAQGPEKTPYAYTVWKVQETRIVQDPHKSTPSIVSRITKALKPTTCDMDKASSSTALPSTATDLTQSSREVRKQLFQRRRRKGQHSSPQDVKHKAGNTMEDVVRVYSCSLCSQTFTSRLRCQRHERQHVCARDFFCQVCGLTARSESHYQHHLQQHQKGFSICCLACGKLFPSRQQLDKHTPVHSTLSSVATHPVRATGTSTPSSDTPTHITLPTDSHTLTTLSGDASTCEPNIWPPDTYSLKLSNAPSQRTAKKRSASSDDDSHQPETKRSDLTLALKKTSGYYGQAKAECDMVSRKARSSDRVSAQQDSESTLPTQIVTAGHTAGLTSPSVGVTMRKSHRKRFLSRKRCNCCPDYFSPASSPFYLSSRKPYHSSPEGRSVSMLKGCVTEASASGHNQNNSSDKLRVSKKASDVESSFPSSYNSSVGRKRSHRSSARNPEARLPNKIVGDFHLKDCTVQVQRLSDNTSSDSGLTVLGQSRCCKVSSDDNLSETLWHSDAYSDGESTMLNKKCTVRIKRLPDSWRYSSSSDDAQTASYRHNWTGSSYHEYQLPLSSSQMKCATKNTHSLPVQQTPSNLIHAIETFTLKPNQTSTLKTDKRHAAKHNSYRPVKIHRTASEKMLPKNLALSRVQNRQFLEEKRSKKSTKESGKSLRQKGQRNSNLNRSRMQPGQCYNCPICDSHFRNSNEMKIHVNKHLRNPSARASNEPCSAPLSGATDALSCVCHRCGHTAQDVAELSRHMRLHPTKTYTCQACWMTFHTVNTFRRHLRGHGTSQRTPSVPFTPRGSRRTKRRKVKT